MRSFRGLLTRHRGPFLDYGRRLRLWNIGWRVARFDSSRGVVFIRCRIGGLRYHCRRRLGIEEGRRMRKDWSGHGRQIGLLGEYTTDCELDLSSDSVYIVAEAVLSYMASTCQAVYSHLRVLCDLVQGGMQDCSGQRKSSNHLIVRAWLSEVGDVSSCLTVAPSLLAKILTRSQGDPSLANAPVSIDKIHR